VHYVVPGGGVNDDGSQWLPARADFFVPVKALSKIARAQFRDAMRQAGLLELIDPAVWQKAWVVHAKAVGDGRAALKYLAPYVFRVAISDHRIRACDHGQVTFSYRKTGSRRCRAMTVEAHEFLRRFLQHVLPRGFQKVRYYGFLSPNSAYTADKLRWLASLHAQECFVLEAKQNPASPEPSQSLLRCAVCGGRLRVERFIRFVGRAPFDTS
jgi:hypothetical protein